MKKLIKGSVATYCEFQDGKMVTMTRPLRVLRNYIKWGENPKHWSNIRAAELSAALHWALTHLDENLVREQDLEERNTEI